MRIITLNLWGREGPWRARHALAARQLRGLAPDLLCLQEVVGWDDLLGLAEALTMSVLVADPGGSDLAVLATPRVRREVRATEQRECVTRSPLEERSRGACLLRLRDGSTVLTTHLSWRADDGATRRAQLDELLGWMGEVPALLCGDLNAPLDAPELAPLWEQGFGDALQGWPAATRPTWDLRNPYTAPYGGSYPSQRLDHVLVNLAWRAKHRVVDAQVVLDEPDQGLLASDHYGVCVELQAQAVSGVGARSAHG